MHTYMIRRWSEHKYEDRISYSERLSVYCLSLILVTRAMWFHDAHVIVRQVQPQFPLSPIPHQLGHGAIKLGEINILIVELSQFWLSIEGLDQSWSLQVHHMHTASTRKGKKPNPLSGRILDSGLFTAEAFWRLICWNRRSNCLRDQDLH